MSDSVLIIDDETFNPLAIVLERYGFRVHTAEDGRSGIEAAERLRPDVVLLDIKLPVLNGFEVLEELKRRSIATRVVMMSGYFRDRDTTIRCIRSGACDFFEKPMVCDEIVDRLRRHILVEKTLNLRVADTAPLVDKLMLDFEELNREASNCAARCARWRFCSSASISARRSPTCCSRSARRSCS